MRRLSIAISVCAGVLAGCRPARPPDVAAEAAALTGIDGAIAFGDAPPEGPPADGEALSLARAVRLALSHDPRVRASLAKVRVAEAEANQARLLPNPILTLDVRYPFSHGSNTVFEPSLAADLLSLVQKPAQIAAADKRLRGSAAAALGSVLDAVSEVQQAYASARSVELELENADRRQQRVRKLRELARKRLAAGETSRLDVMTLDSQVLQAEIALSDLRLQRVQSRLLLAKLVGDARAGGDWRLDAVEADEEGGAAEAGDERAWVDAALARRPEVGAARWELAALGDDYAAASLPPLSGGEVGAHAERDPDWRLGPAVSFPLPIFDFGQAARARVAAQRDAARYDLDRQSQDVIQDVRLALATYRHARETLGQYERKLLPLQVGQTEQAQRAYQAGEADLATLILAENDLELTRSKILELREAVAVARAKLNRAAGGGSAARQIRPAPSTGAATRPAATTPAPGGNP